MKIHTVTMNGNIHVAAVTINKSGLAEYLLDLHYTGPGMCIAIFRMPDELVWKLREEDPCYISDSHHDDPVDNYRL